MKRSILLAALAALLVSGCAWRHHGDGHGGGTRPLDPTRPAVSVVNNKIIVVDQEPLVFRPEQKDVTITWSLPAGQPFRFTRDGIVVEKGGEEIVGCQAADNGLRFTCLNRNRALRQIKYAYSIKLTTGDREIVSDPTIVNMRE